MSNLRRRSKTRLKAPTALVAVSLVLFTAFIVGGGVYDLLDHPPPIRGRQGGIITVFGVQSEQTLLESLVSMVFSVLIFLGLFISYGSTQIIYDSKRATTTLILGIALILMGLAGSHYLLTLKRLVLSKYGY